MELAAAIHGAYDIETGERLIREAFVKVPKKNWKSGFAGLLMLSLMALNWRPSNEAGIIAPTKDTADNVFKPMRDAIKADPRYDAVFHIQPNMRTITHRVTGMSCRVYAADSDAVAGQKWAFVIFEELWLLAKRKGAADMMLEATGGQASRPEGVVISITTESDEPAVGVHREKEEFARDVRDGKIAAPHFLPLLYEWPEDMLKAKAYLTPENFPLVNPNWGASVDPEDFIRKFTEAERAGGDAMRSFLAKRLNVSPSENVGGGWAGAAYWKGCAEPGLTFDALLARCEVIDVGIDGGGLDDMLGLSIVGRERDTGRWLHWGRAWLHPIAMERRKSEAQRYEDFQRQGDLVLVESIGDDVDEVASIVAEIEAAGLLDRVGVDPAGLGGILDALEAAGVPKDKVIGISQGWKLSGTIKTAERRLAERALLHCDQDLMAWCIGNAKVVPVGNAVNITKQASGTAKIDPLMAMLNAVSLMALNPEGMGGMDDWLSSPVKAAA